MLVKLMFFLELGDFVSQNVCTIVAFLQVLNNMAANCTKCECMSHSSVLTSMGAVLGAIWRWGMFYDHQP